MPYSEVIIFPRYWKYVSRVFKIWAFFFANQDSAKNLLKMTKFTKAPKVKKYLDKNYNIDLCFQLYYWIESNVYIFLQFKG